MASSLGSQWDVKQLTQGSQGKVDNDMVTAWPLHPLLTSVWTQQPWGDVSSHLGSLEANGEGQGHRAYSMPSVWSSVAKSVCDLVALKESLTGLWLF